MLNLSISHKHDLFEVEGGIKKRSQQQVAAPTPTLRKALNWLIVKRSLPPHVSKLVLAAQAVLRTRAVIRPVVVAVFLLATGAFACWTVILLVWLTLPALPHGFLMRLV